MQKRKIDELISYFNRKVANMDIDMEYRMELLGMITAIGIACEKELSIEPERKTGKWIKNSNGTYSCDKCHSWIPNEQHYYANFCLHCGAVMIGEGECTKKM